MSLLNKMVVVLEVVPLCGEFNTGCQSHGTVVTEHAGYIKRRKQFYI